MNYNNFFGISSGGTLFLEKMKREEFISQVSVLEIPEKLNGVTVKNIKNCTFNHCENLTKLILPDTVEKIGSDAFSGCKNLKYIRFSKNLKRISIRAFKNCYLVKDIDLGKLEFVGASAFENCISLRNIKVSVRSLQSKVFKNCINLKNIDIGEDCLYIFSDAFFFFFCLNEIKIPRSILSIDKFTFDYCKNLHTIYIPDSYTCTHKNIYAINKKIKIINY